jgi:D-beta-D-heptose 7-phosphate kinase/D-beta-D-heptose 1-phosphate adenosyltransferase
MPTWDALAIADYGKGYLTSEFVDSILKIARQCNIPVVVDTKPKNIDLFKEVSVITPNAKEAVEMTGTEDLESAGRNLMERVKCPVLITCGGDGMLLFTLDNSLLRIPARQTNVVDVSGAGDTVVTALALALAARIPLIEAVHLSNIAASLVVAKPGTATVSDSELFSAL